MVTPIYLRDLRRADDATDVALFTGAMEGGGAERALLYLASELVGSGISVDIVVCKRIGSLLDEVPEGVRLIVLDTKRVIFSAPALAAYSRRVKPRVMMSAVENANIVSCLARLMAWRSLPRLVLHIDNALFQPKPLLKQLRRLPWILASTLTFHISDEIVAVSNGLRDQVTKLPFLRASAVTVIYNPILRSDFEALADEDLWDLRPNGPIVLATGRLEPQKDYPTLIKAFARVTRETKAHLVILGEGNLRNQLEKLVSELGLEGQVTFAGFLLNPYPYMRKADVFVLSSAWEGFGNVLVEALACGPHVVSTMCDFGPSEILDDGKFGSLVPVGDDRALADAIVSSLRLPRQERSTDLRNHLAQFEVERIAVIYRNFFRLNSQTGKLAEPTVGVSR